MCVCVCVCVCYVHMCELVCVECCRSPFSSCVLNLFHSIPFYITYVSYTYSTYASKTRLSVACSSCPTPSPPPGNSIDSSFTLKIADSALTYDLLPDFYHCVYGVRRPVRWAALETLTQGISETKSNVVSWACGRTPRNLFI